MACIGSRNNDAVYRCPDFRSAQSGIRPDRVVRRGGRYHAGRSGRHPGWIRYAEHRNIGPDFKIPEYFHRLPDRKRPVSDDHLLRR